MMTSAIDFYLDFSSPYSYLASEQIEALAARYGRSVAYKPVLLGAVFKHTGSAPLTEQHASKASYSVRDFERSARHAGVTFRQPSVFPIGTVNAARGLLWLQSAHPEKANEFVHAAFRAFFAQDRNISDPAVLAAVVAECDIDVNEFAAAVQQPAIKDALRQATEDAVARGVFGAPFMFVDGEAFWGNDRLAQLEWWLSQSAHKPQAAR